MWNTVDFLPPLDSLLFFLQNYSLDITTFLYMTVDTKLIFNQFYTFIISIFLCTLDRNYNKTMHLKSSLFIN